MNHTAKNVFQRLQPGTLAAGWNLLDHVSPCGVDMSLCDHFFDQATDQGGSLLGRQFGLVVHVAGLIQFFCESLSAVVLMQFPMLVRIAAHPSAESFSVRSGGRGIRRAAASTERSQVLYESMLCDLSALLHSLIHSVAKVDAYKNSRIGILLPLRTEWSTTAAPEMVRRTCCRPTGSYCKSGMLADQCRTGLSLLRRHPPERRVRKGNRGWLAWVEVVST